MIASLKGYAPVVKLLLKYGADPDHAGHDGNNALSLALGAGHVGIAALLHGAILQ
jgi:ankyrin repeat protein